MLKKQSCFILGAMALTSLPAYSFEVNDSTNAYLTVTAVSDYRSNGLSQTKGDPALQSELSVVHDSGLLVGLWASSVDFGTKTRLEHGGYIGVLKQVNDDFSFIANMGKFIYPKNSSYSLNEFYGEVNYKNLKYKFIYDFDMEDSPDAKYQYLGYMIKTPLDSSLYLEFGYHDIGDILYSSSGDVRNNYITKKATLKKTIAGVDWSMTYIDTDISEHECLYNLGYEDVCGAGVVFGASKTF